MLEVLNFPAKSIRLRTTCGYGSYDGNAVRWFPVLYKVVLPKFVPSSPWKSGRLALEPKLFNIMATLFRPRAAVNLFKLTTLVDYLSYLCTGDPGRVEINATLCTELTGKYMFGMLVVGTIVAIGDTLSGLT